MVLLNGARQTGKTTLAQEFARSHSITYVTLDDATQLAAAQAMRLSTYRKPRVIACAEDHPRHIGLPRGCLDSSMSLLKDIGIRVEIDRCEFSR